MAMGRLNRPGIMVYGGTIKVSNHSFLRTISFFSFLLLMVIETIYGY